MGFLKSKKRFAFLVFLFLIILNKARLNFLHAFHVLLPKNHNIFFSKNFFVLIELIIINYYMLFLIKKKYYNFMESNLFDLNLFQSSLKLKIA